MRSTIPRVSIGVPVRNGEKYLAQALESVAGQSFGDFEVLIADNASTDGTEDIARAFCGRDARFRYHRQLTNVGAAGNFNHVFYGTSAPYFRWQAHDDLVAPDHLLECVGALDRAGPEAVLAFPRTLLIDATGRELGVYEAVTRRGGATPSARLEALVGRGDHTRSHLHMCFPVFGLIRRSALARTSLIANMPRADRLLLVELALMGRWREIGRPLFLRRTHDDGSVIAAEKGASGPELERQLAAWFDPRRATRFPATVSRLTCGYLSAVLRTPMPAAERLKCLSVLGGLAARQSRVIGGEIKIVLREELARRGMRAGLHA